MKWNNRVMEQQDGSLQVHEVFYEDDGTIIGWAEECEIGGFEELDHLYQHVKTIYKDLKRAKSGELPIVKYDEWYAILEKGGKDDMA